MSAHRNKTLNFLKKDPRKKILASDAEVRLFFASNERPWSDYRLLVSEEQDRALFDARSYRFVFRDMTFGIGPSHISMGNMADLVDFEFVNCTFHRLKKLQTDFAESTFFNCTFTDCDLAGTCFDSCSFFDCVFIDCIGERTSFESAAFYGGRFANFNAHKASFLAVFFDDDFDFGDFASLVDLSYAEVASKESMARMLLFPESHDWIYTVNIAELPDEPR